MKHCIEFLKQPTNIAVIYKQKKSFIMKMLEYQDVFEQ